MLATSFSSAMLGAFLGWLVIAGASPVHRGTVGLDDDCTGQEACPHFTFTSGGLSVGFSAGTGQRPGLCGCPPSTPEVCQEVITCQANYVAGVQVGIGKGGSHGGACTAADASGVVFVNLACSGCNCRSITINVQSCDMPGCTNCGSSASVLSGCLKGLCPGTCPEPQ